MRSSLEARGVDARQALTQPKLFAELAEAAAMTKAEARDALFALAPDLSNEWGAYQAAAAAPAVPGHGGRRGLGGPLDLLATELARRKGDTSSGGEKVFDVRKRLLAVAVGAPLKAGDTEASLRADYRALTGRDWSPAIGVLDEVFHDQIRKRALRHPAMPLSPGPSLTSDQRSQIPQAAVNVRASSSGNEVVYQIASREWFRRAGRLTEIDDGAARARVVFRREQDYAAYDPISDTFSLGEAAVKDAKDRPNVFEMAWSHERAHKAYFALSAKDQTTLNDQLLQHPKLRLLIERFAAGLYGDTLKTLDGRTAGDGYLQTHDAKNAQSTGSYFVKDGERGIKDPRVLTVSVNGKPREVIAGLLITELISYMSAAKLGPDVFREVVDSSRAKRGGADDPRYDTSYYALHMVEADPTLASLFAKARFFEGDRVADRVRDAALRAP